MEKTSALFGLSLLTSVFFSPSVFATTVGSSTQAIDLANPRTSELARLAFGGTVWIAEGGALPSVHVDVVWTESRHIDLLLELESLAVASAARIGLDVHTLVTPDGSIRLSLGAGLLGAYAANDGTWGSIFGGGLAAGPAATLVLGPVTLTTRVDGILGLVAWTGTGGEDLLVAARSSVDVEAEVVSGFRPFLRASALVSETGSLGTVSLGVAL